MHRDIKPSNVLRDGPNIWLADFGLAAGRKFDGKWRALPAPWTETEIGSPAWVAPELAGDPGATQTANDVYGVGRVWQAMAALIADEPSSLRELRARMLSPDPAARPSIDEVLASIP